MSSPAVATTPDIEALIASGAPVAIGVSGGKDSQAAALATFDHLNAAGHRGPRVLIHSDLGSVEWDDSLPTCQRLAAHLNCELIVVRRKAGGMVERWDSRWISSVRRYASLETVNLVLPWSTPSMRFCTSELKTHVIGAELRRRFKGSMIINVTGVRREESTARSKGTIANREADGKAFSWRPISDWTTDEVFARIDASGLAAHQAYADYGLSRVSCRFCLAGETEVVTRDGIRPIASLAGGTHELLIPTLNAYRKTTTNGSFKPVEVREFGKQRLLRIELKTQRRQRKVLLATPEHRWFVTAISPRGDACSIEKVSSDLVPGDKLKNLIANGTSDCVEVPFAVAQGFVFGDGCKPSGDRPAELTIYNNQKDDTLLRYFAAHNIRRGREGQLRIYGLPRTWKKLPDIRESRSFLMSWLAGHFAADGCVSKEGAARMDSSVRENIEFARDVAAICGVGHGQIRTTMRRGFHKDSTPLYHINLTPGDLPPWFFVIREHRKRAQVAQERGRPGKTREQWVVDTITETDRFESVYCAVVPEAQAFGLADGLMTGNCIMSSMADLKAAAGAAESLELYRHLVSLEIRSTFGFQGARWLADIAPRLLTPAMSGDVDCAKQKAAARVALEKRITTEMLYVKGWPTRMLTDEEAGILADVRAQVSTLLGIEAQYLEVPSIHHRYAELIAANEARVSEAA